MSNASPRGKRRKQDRQTLPSFASIVAQIEATSPVRRIPQDVSEIYPLGVVADPPADQEYIPLPRS